MKRKYELFSSQFVSPKVRTLCRSELLAPAGNFAMLSAAVNAGADAVYFGLKEFNMRAGARNFSFRDLKKINEICAKKKVKKYLTLNTIIFENELGKVERIIKKLRGKVDAIICWDLSVVNLCKKYKIPFHISTQASISNSSSAKFYEKLGAERIILARELSLEQIKKISKKVKAEIECFCHGAMCVSVSGRCFTSQFLCGKSANRGECSHPCRREYKIVDLTDSKNELVLENNRVMSAKDLCCLPFIEEMKKAGVKCFKIEGRNRSPEYVSVVTKIYRRALDKEMSKKEIEKSVEELKKVYNRGFSRGFYFGFSTNEFSNSDSGEQKEKKVFVGKVKKFLSRISVALVEVVDNSIKLGDEIYIIGERTGVVRQRIESMEINNKKVFEARRGSEVGIKTEKCREHDEVFLIKNK
jgi:putative protease